MKFILTRIVIRRDKKRVLCACVNVFQRQAGLNFTMSESGKDQSFSGRPAIAASMFLAAVTAHS